MLQDVFCLRLLEAIAREGRGPTEVARKMCGELRARTGAAVGVVGITADGRPFVAHACPHMSWAWRGAGISSGPQGGLSAPGGDDEAGLGAQA